MTGQFSLNFLHRCVFLLATQEQSLVLFFTLKELASSQPPGGVVGAETGGDGDVPGAGVQKLVFSNFPISQC